jgi:hypothetical protein
MEKTMPRTLPISLSVMPDVEWETSATLAEIDDGDAISARAKSLCAQDGFAWELDFTLPYPPAGHLRGNHIQVSSVVSVTWRGRSYAEAPALNLFQRGLRSGSQPKRLLRGSALGSLQEIRHATRFSGLGRY